MTNDTTTPSTAPNAAAPALTQETQRRTWILRVCFVASLACAAAICGVVAYRVISDLEEDVGQQTYRSVASAALEGAQEITLRKLQGADVMTSTLSFAYPNASQWPFVALNGYSQTAGRVAKLSASTSQGLITIVQPDQVEQFEVHAAQTYREQGYPEGAGESDFGFGIWRRISPNSTYKDGKVHDTGDGVYNYETKYNFLAPIFLHNIQKAPALMFNTKSNVFRGTAIDSMFDCAADYANNIYNTTTTTTSSSENNNAVEQHEPSCGVVTDFVTLLVRPGPAALLYKPVFAASDLTTIVGVTGTSIHWAEVLTNVVPDYVDGLDCVISNGKQSVTYVIHKGRPQLVDWGNHHDRNFDKWAEDVVLNDQESKASASESYTLTVYPTEQMFTAFSTNSPVAISLGFVGVILFCTALFFCYDFFMRHESRQRKVVLEMKRLFVRFVSHEIRTPLNTVCMGLELLRTEMESIVKGCEKEGDGEDERITIDKNTLSDWLDLLSDINENSDNSVVILNDLLNYDKIETGTFQLEIGVVDIWDLIRRTVSAFDIQARKRSVALSLEMEVDHHNVAATTGVDVDDDNHGDTPDVEEPTSPGCLKVIGDDMRLRQVIRNLVSNALKFSPESDGMIHITVSYISDGLPHAKPQTKDGEHMELLRQPRQGSIQIAIKDNGAGLSEEQLSRIFVEGVQFEANKLQAGGGSGLGLFITKGLVERHGGIIGVSSDGLECGATFTVELPLYKFPEDWGSNALDVNDDGVQMMRCCERATSTASTVTAGTSLSTKVQPEHHHILVVDDAAMNRKMLIRLLEINGHVCESAVNGQDAIDKFKADQEKAQENEFHFPFDTILMDYEMPVVNGPDATWALREMGCMAYIVGVTGNVLAEDVAYFKSMGADDVLAKPVNISLLDESWEKLRR